MADLKKNDLKLWNAIILNIQDALTLGILGNLDNLGISLSCTV